MVPYMNDPASIKIVILSSWPRLIFFELKITSILQSSGWGLEKKVLPWEQHIFPCRIVGVFQCQTTLMSTVWLGIFPHDFWTLFEDSVLTWHLCWRGPCHVHAWRANLLARGVHTFTRTSSFSITATSPHPQRPLKLVSTVKTTSRQRPVNQQLTNTFFIVIGL